MQITTLLEKLDRFHPRILRLDAPFAPLHYLKLLHPGQTIFDQACLYIGHVSDLPEQPALPGPEHLLLIEDRPLPDAYSQQSAPNLVLTDQQEHLAELANQIGEILLGNFRAVAGIRRLLLSARKEEGLGVLLNTAAQVFGNPVIFLNNNLDPLEGSDNAAANTRLGFRLTPQGEFDQTSMNKQDRENILTRLRTATEPVYLEDPLLELGWPFCPVRIQGICVGHLAMPETRLAIRPEDYEIFAHLAEMSAAELEKQDYYHAAKGRYYNFLLSDLLGGRIHSQESLRCRLTYLDWQLDGNFLFLVLPLPGEGTRSSTLAYMTKQIREIFSDCKLTTHGERLALLVHRPARPELHADEINALQKFILTNRISIGVSQVFDSLLTVRKHYDLANHALGLGIYLGDDPGLFLYNDYAIMHITRIISQNHALPDFCHPALKALRALDGEDNGPLTKTLRLYLEYPEQPQATAQQLGIHRNTLLSRLQRIRERTGLDLSNGLERLKLHLSFLFMDYEFRTGSEQGKGLGKVEGSLENK